MLYSFTRAQVLGLLLAAVSIGINSAVVMVFIAEGRATGAIAATVTVMMMLVAIVALLRIGREAAERVPVSRTNA